MSKLIYYSICLFLASLLFCWTAEAINYKRLRSYEDYLDETNFINSLPRKRACIRRGANCDNRPDDCCFSSSCRCNLWGTNCRCQRMGLFQRWGK